MSVIIKYQLEFPEIELSVSNDVMSGKFILDSDISVKMARGMDGSTFDIKLSDLPLEIAKLLRDRVKTFASVIIKLGYFGGPFEQVMEGVIKDMRSTAQGDKLITALSGQEIGTYALQKNIVLRRENVSIKDAVKIILKEAKTIHGKIAENPNLNDLDKDDKNKLRKIKFSHTLMEALDQLAESAGAEFFVCDKTVWMGKPIKDENYSLKLKRETNLAVFSPINKKVPQELAPDLSNPLQATDVEGYRFTILGDPKLRPGQKVEANVDDYDKVEFRVHSVVHKFSTSGGYVCEGAAMKAVADDNCRRREKNLFQPSANNFVGKLADKVEAEQRHRPWIEMGKVKAYTAGSASGDEKHTGTFYFRQRFERTEMQPSLNTEVDTNEEQVFNGQPMVSPFAWHRCGLMVPVYQGMKAVLQHNLNLHDDVLVAGFIWSEKPAIEPPKNKAGDWWLCLPIDFKTSKPPQSDTKAANDLIANNGKRVIEVKGLKITIGKDKLPNVGERPSEGGDDEFFIEHKSGTKFKIASDGALTIEAKNISIKGDVAIEGNVDIK